MKESEQLIELHKSYLNLTTEAENLLRTGDFVGSERILTSRGEVAAAIDRIGACELDEVQRKLLQRILKQSKTAQKSLFRMLQQHREQMMQQMEVLRRAKRLAESYDPQPEDRKSVALDRIG